MNVWGKGGFGVKGSYDYGIADAVSIGAGVGIYSEGKTVDGNKNRDICIRTCELPPKGCLGTSG